VNVTRIVLGDDHPLVRRGLRDVLDGEPDMTVVAEAADGAEAVSLAVEHEADVAVLDVAMPRLTGIQAVERLRRERPETRALMLSIYDNDQYLLAAARAGAAGYVLKSVADEQVVEACRRVASGCGFVYPSGIAAHTRKLVERALHGAAPDEVLTPREREVLKLVAEGRTSAEIATELFISIKTVETHRTHISAKLGARDRVELTRYAIRTGLVEP
jgi:DNA-binding NarL/FixJ family response regulator